MKNISKLIIGLAGAALVAGSCTSVLEEHPKTLYTPDFFTTELGVDGGLTSLYSHLRYLYGQGYWFNSLETGTDEYTYANQADDNFKAADRSGAGTINASTSRSDVLWNAAFSNINTASGIIENAEDVGLSQASIAEAKFFRAFDYFLLVQTFGGVPLDLGSGVLAFNSSPVRESTRNTVPEVYTQAIFPDLIFALENLPVEQRVPGALTQQVARLYLAKAYLTYAWWLENPNNIPTYPECPRTDPDGHDAKWYFQKAYDLSAEAIDNPGPFGLMDTFYQVNAGQFDRNKEILFYADHTENSEKYNGASLTYGDGNAPNNFAGWMAAWNYPTMQAKTGDGKAVAPVLRTDGQSYGRPWIRMAPTQEGIATFTNKDKDSRFDGTFTYMFLTNWDAGGNNYDYVVGPHGAKIGLGEPFVTFLPEEDPSVVYDFDASSIMLGSSPNYDSYVVNPSGVNRCAYPNVWKLGPYRTNTAGVGQPNAGSTRPFNIAKFSEFYFVAAEAAVKGADTVSGKSARELINVLRARAGKWTYHNNSQKDFVADYSDELCAETPQEITIDYILDEMLREYFAEGRRWFDLARTQTWVERASSYTIGGPGKFDHDPIVTKRTIEPYHYLFPIPQGQIDFMKMDDALKAAYQNPGYPVE